MPIEINFEENASKKKQIDYDDILKNMGMREIRGKLFWEKNNSISNENFVAYEPGQRNKKMQQPKVDSNKLTNQNSNQLTNKNSYIYNKYFKNEFKEQQEIQKPTNIIEYRNMLIRQIIEKKRINQIKSRQMVFR